MWLPVWWLNCHICKKSHQDGDPQSGSRWVKKNTITVQHFPSCCSLYLFCCCCCSPNLLEGTIKSAWCVTSITVLGWCFFFIHMNNMLIYVVSCVCPASCTKNFIIGHYLQTIQPIFFHACHACRHHWLLPFRQLSLTLTLPGGHKVSSDQNVLASFSGTLFSWSGWNLTLCWSKSSWTSWY